MKEVKSPKKPLIYYYSIILLIVLLFNLIVSPLLMKNQVTEVDYGTFMRMIEEKNIGEVEVEDDEILFTDKDKQQVYTTGAMDEPTLTGRLYDSGATFTKEIQKTMSPVLSFVLTAVLPLAIFIAIGQYMGKKLVESAGGKNSLMFGGTGALIGGFDPFIQGDYSHLGLDIPLWVYIVFQTVFCATAATIVSGSMAERTNFKAYCVYSAAISLVVYPICGHWMWGGGWLQSMGFHDFAGSAAVHNVGGVIALLGAWMLAYYAVEAVATRVPPSIGGTMWGLFFFINMLSGMLVRFAMRKLGIVHLIDGDSMTRLTGWMMEFLLLSTLIGIKFAVVKDYILPIIVLSVVLAVFTLFFILYFGRRVPGYSFERTVMMFGTCTGTIPTGLILLRMVDSELKTTVSVEAGMWNMAVFIFFYVNFIFHGYVVYGWGMPATLGLFALTFLANYIILRVFKLIGPKQF